MRFFTLSWINSHIKSHGKTINVWRYNIKRTSRVSWNYFESTSVSDESIDAKPPARQQFVSHAAKRITPNLGPWGTPPFSVNQSDKVSSTLTACFRFVKSPVIQARSAGWFSRLANSCINIEWSISSNPLVKSAKKIRADASPLSTAS